MHRETLENLLCELSTSAMSSDRWLEFFGIIYKAEVGGIEVAPMISPITNYNYENWKKQKGYLV